MKRVIRTMLGLSAALLVAGQAQATIYTATAGFLGAGQGCADSSCSTEIYQLDTSGGISGTIEIDSGVLDFNLTLASSTFDATPSDGGITSIEFLTTVYSGAVNVTEGPPGLFSVDGGQFGAVTGSVQPTGAGALAPVASTQSLLSGSCTVGGATTTCGLVFSPLIDFTVTLNGNVRYFSHTLNATAVPEPATAVLFILGMGAAAAVGRSRTH